MSRLSLFGAIHFDRRSKVEDELSKFAAEDGADAIFVEWPAEELTRRTALHGLVAVPILVLGGVVLDLVRSPYYLLFNRRFDSSEHMVAERLDRPVHEIDRHPWALMAEMGWLAIALNWLVLVAFLVVAPLGTAATTAALLVGGGAVRAAATRNRRLAALAGTLVLVGLEAAATVADLAIGGFALALTALPLATAATLAVSTRKTVAVAVRIPVVAVAVTMALLAEAMVGLFVLTAFAAFAVFVGKTLDTRNEHMAERIAAIAREEGYDASVLVTGKAHLPGMVNQATDAGLTVERTYTPRWLRAPGKIEDHPESEATETGTTEPDGPSDELGSAGARAAASLVDAIALGVLVWIPAGGLALATGELLGDPVSGFLVGFVLTPLVYHAALEAAFGRTLGKHLEELVVTDAEGSPASARACVLRNLLHPVDFLPFYALGFLTLLLTDRRQRLGDLVAGTEVRKTG